MFRLFRFGSAPRRHAALVVAALVFASSSAVAFAQVVAPGQRPPAPVAPPKPSVFGLWIDHTSDGAVEIVPCPDKRTGEVCGTIVWLKNPNDARGLPLRDGYNEDDRQRRRPICGLPVLGALKRQSDGTYDEGWVYDPRQGKSFSVELTLLKGEQLQVKGYKGFKLLSKTFIWTRATTELPRCVPPAATQPEAKREQGAAAPAPVRR